LLKSYAEEGRRAPFGFADARALEDGGKRPVARDASALIEFVRVWRRLMVKQGCCLRRHEGQMFRRVHEIPFRGSGPGFKAAARLAALLSLVGCAAGTTTTTARPDTVPSHIYPLPLDNVLAQATQLLAKMGWRVQHSGDNLFTNWVGGTLQSPQQDQVGEGSATASIVAYRVFGERIDATYCTIRVERLVATSSTLDFGQKKGGHQVEQTTSTVTGRPTAVHNEQRTLLAPFGTQPEFEEDSENVAAAGVPANMVVSQHARDIKLELTLQEQIDPPIVAATPQAVPMADPSTDGGVAAEPSAPLAQRPDGGPPAAMSATPRLEVRPTDLAGIWDGTFTFRGKVTGAFSGEVTVAVDGDVAEVDDFCPESGGTISMTASHHSASWQGKLACPAIRMSGCPSAVVTYNFVNATLSDTTLTVTAAGTVDTGGRCLDSGGELSVGGQMSVTFVAQRADYVHIAVSRAKRVTACRWPSDWEDFTSAGSMPLPEPAVDDSGYLGIIRARGSRLGDIQRLLRHCRQVVLLHGQPVLMRLAVTRPHRQ
jgi:hypothetical protein